MILGIYPRLTGRICPCHGRSRCCCHARCCSRKRRREVAARKGGFSRWLVRTPTQTQSLCLGCPAFRSLVKVIIGTIRQEHIEFSANSWNYRLIVDTACQQFFTPQCASGTICKRISQLRRSCRLLTGTRGHRCGSGSSLLRNGFSWRSLPDGRLFFRYSRRHGFPAGLVGCSPFCREISTFGRSFGRPALLQSSNDCPSSGGTQFTLRLRRSCGS